MLWSLLVLTATAAGPSLALPGLNGVNLSPSETALFESLLSSELSRVGLSVLANRDIAAMLGLERQKQLLGCNDDHQCLTEVAGALGVDALLLGDVGRIGKSYTVNLRVVGAQNGKVLATHIATVATVDDVPAELRRAAGELEGQLLSALRGGQRFSRLWALLPAGVAIGGAVAAVVLHLQAATRYRELIELSGRLGTAPLEELTAQATTSRTQGLTAQVWGNVAIGVAAAAVVATVVTLFGASAPRVQPTAMLGPTGASFGLVGVLP